VEAGDLGQESVRTVATQLRDELRALTGRYVYLLLPPGLRRSGADALDVNGRGEWAEVDAVAKRAADLSAADWWRRTELGMKGAVQHGDSAKRRDAPPLILIYWEHRAAILADQTRSGAGGQPYNELDRLRDQITRNNPGTPPWMTYVPSAQRLRELEQAGRNPARNPLWRILVVGGEPIAPRAQPQRDDTRKPEQAHVLGSRPQPLPAAAEVVPRELRRDRRRDARGPQQANRGPSAAPGAGAGRG
jgi:hypothetical protein